MRIFALSLFFLLAACQAPDLNRFTVYTFSDERPIVLKVSDVVVQSEVMKFNRLPHIEEKLPVSPEEALQEWAHNHFYGADKLSVETAVITIKDAYMTQKEVESANWYTFNNEAYKLTYEVSIAFVRDGNTLYEHTVQGWESSSLPARSSLAEKEGAWQKMLNAMIRKVNGQIVNAIPQTFIAK